MQYKIINLLKELNILYENNHINSNCYKKLDLYIDIMEEVISITKFIPGNIDTIKQTFKARIYCLLHDIQDITCQNKNCNNNCNFQGSKAGFTKYCSRNCTYTCNKIKEKRKKTSLKLFGETSYSKTVEFSLKSSIRQKAYTLNEQGNIKQRRKDTKLQKYGDENYNNRKQAQHTMNLKYNVNHALQNNKFKQKVKQTKLQKYGDENYNNRKKHRETCQEKYNRNHISQIHILRDSLNKLNNKDWLIEQHHRLEKPTVQIAKELGNINYGTVINRLRQFNIQLKSFTVSSEEKEINKFIQDLGIETIENSRDIIIPKEMNIDYPHLRNNKHLLPRKELDIYIPSHNIAIEYCGIWWHSQYGKTQDQMIYRKYMHDYKRYLCEQKNIRLITIFSDEWIYQQDIVKSRLTHLFGKSEKGIYARKTKIIEVDSKTSRDFLNMYHLQGAGSTSKYRYGAVDKSGTLLGLMTFGRRCSENTKNETELKRFVTDKRNHPGLGSKIFKHAINKLNIDSVIAFVDLRWFDGGVKDYIGFKREYILPPGFYWVKGNKRYHRTSMTKKQLMKLDQFKDQDLTKKEMMTQLGYGIIWDCGKKKMKWSK